MKSYQIHFIRHGIIDENLKGKYIGVTDAPLSDYGIDCLKTQVTSYKYPFVPVVYSSPLKRCTQTAKIIYPNTPLLAIDGFKECNFGDFEGKTAEELSDNEDFKNWLSNSENCKPINGEGSMDFAKRVCDTFEKLVEGMLKAGNTNAAVITHAGVIMTLLTTYGLPKANFYDWKVDNGYGFSVRITPGLWMRDKVFEVYERIPK